jgi:hypothetical protein
MEGAIKLWAKHLNGFEDEFVKRALDECVDKFAWCPDVAEFKQLCMSYKGTSKLPWSEEVLKFEKPKNAKVTDEYVRTVIDEGSEICKRLKNIYPDKSWMGIAGLFTELKKKARIYHPGLDDVKLIRELMRYSHQDVIDALG